MDLEFTLLDLKPGSKILLKMWFVSKFEQLLAKVEEDEHYHLRR
jgi:hypothetical protein